MGEFADMLIDQMMDGDFDDELEDSDYFDPGKTCRYCGEGGLAWSFREGHGWRLSDSKGYHKCKSGPFAPK